MSTRRAFLGALAGGLLAAPLAAHAQQAGKMYRVGTLGDRASDPGETRLWQAFRLGLRERGWIEGGSIVFEPRWAEGDTARLPELAADLVRLQVDLIVARSSAFVQAAMAGLEAGRPEIRVGLANVLAKGSRIAPGLVLNIVNKARD